MSGVVSIQALQSCDHIPINTSTQAVLVTNPLQQLEIRVAAAVLVSTSSKIARLYANIASYLLHDFWINVACMQRLSCMSFPTVLTARCLLHSD